MAEMLISWSTAAFGQVSSKEHIDCATVQGRPDNDRTSSGGSLEKTEYRAAICIRVPEKLLHFQSRADACCGCWPGGHIAA
mmetsp:Transcript_74376/g.168478  ORF Transcript_74376/g.168478 Transcript_74376/m.168478 type:complete len:81 (-) Transcript_74376:28-270(-)